MKQTDRPEIINFAHAPESVAKRIQRLSWEAKVLAAEYAEQFAGEVLVLAERATEIADGGEAYPPGVRELCERMANELRPQANSLLAILRQVGPRADPGPKLLALEPPDATPGAEEA